MNSSGLFLRYVGRGVKALLMMFMIVWLFRFLMIMFKNICSLKLCSMVNFILGCSF